MPAYECYYAGARLLDKLFSIPVLCYGELSTVTFLIAYEYKARDW